jgi:hypothetical protein
MPGFDGTGPSGQGPLTGQGRGFCILKNSEEKPRQLQCYAGLQGTRIGQINEIAQESRKKIVDVSFAYGRLPACLKPLTRRAAVSYMGFLGSRYMNPVVHRITYCPYDLKAFHLYGAGPHGYRAPYGVPRGGRFSSWLCRGYLFGRGSGCRLERGRGRLAYWL